MLVAQPLFVFALPFPLVIAVAAVRAQRGSSAVISSRVARIGNASANVSSIRTPLSCTGRGPSLVAGSTIGVLPDATSARGTKCEMPPPDPACGVG